MGGKKPVRGAIDEKSSPKVIKIHLLGNMDVNTKCHGSSAGDVGLCWYFYFLAVSQFITEQCNHSPILSIYKMEKIPVEDELHVQSMHEHIARTLEYLSALLQYILRPPGAAWSAVPPEQESETVFSFSGII